MSRYKYPDIADFMFISQTAEYALRSVVCLATFPDTPLTTQQIAKITKIPGSYLSKVLQELGRANIVRSQRGLHGGFVLVRPTEELTIFEVIEAVAPFKFIETCPLDLKTHGRNLCALHKRLNDSLKSVRKAFERTTLKELLNEKTGSIPLFESKEKA